MVGITELTDDTFKYDMFINRYVTIYKHIILYMSVTIKRYKL